MKIEKDKNRWIIEPQTASDYYIAELIIEALKAMCIKKKELAEQQKYV